MKKLNKILYAAVMILFLVVQGCSSGSSDDYDEPPVPVQPGDNVVFSNQTEFAVKVYSDSMRSVLVTDVAAKESVSLHVDVVPAGNVFYFSYFMDVNGVSVPYSITDGRTVLLNDSSATSVKITDPESVNTKNRIILLKNEASSAIVLNNGNKEEIPEGKSSALINSGDYGVYMLKATDAVENIRVSEGAKSVALSTAADFENGYIYTIVYDGTKIYMRSKSFLDRNMNKKIWKIRSSREPGNTLIVTYLCRQKNGHGYTAVGKIGYDSSTVNTTESHPYFASIDSAGNVSDLMSEFRDKPIRSEFFDIAESDEMNLILGWNLYSDDKSNCFVMSNDNHSIYKSFVEDGDEYLYDPVSIIHKKDNVFCVLIAAYGRTNSEPYQYQLYEISVNGYDTVSFKKIYESEDDGIARIANEFVYDGIRDMYVVLFQEEENGTHLELSAFSFIDATSGEKKQEDLVLKNHLFNYMDIMPGTDYVYASGSYVNQITSKDVASFAKIDIASGSVVNENGKPVQYPATSPNLNSNFSWFTLKDNEIVFAGYTDADYEQGGTDINYSDAYPLIVSYNLNDSSKVYEQIYNDMKGFIIETVDSSALDTLLLKLWNQDTNECYIISTGFFGALPKDEKLSLPYNVKTEIAAPDLTIEFHEDYSSDDVFNECTFKYGTTVSLSDLEQYADAPAGYSVVGWYDRNNNEEDVEISVPFVITEKMKLYPKFKISPPTGVYGWATSDSEIYVRWDEHPFAQNYCLYWSDSYGNGGDTPVSNAASCTISGLNSGTSYTIEVIAYDNSKAEWSERSAGCTIQTETATNWGEVPSYAEELPLNTGGINTHVYLNPGDVHYYYAYFEAGRSYCVWWADSYEGIEYLEDWELTPCADAAVSVYYAGDAEADFIDSGYAVPYKVCCSKSGYYLIELRGFGSDATGWCAITCYEKVE